MTFKELMMALYKAKSDAQSLGLSDKQISNLEIIDVGILNTINKKEFEITIGKKDLKHYLLIKDKKQNA